MSELATYDPRQQIAYMQRYDAASIKELAGNLRTLVKNGQKLNDNELITLAKAGAFYGLDPIMGELSYIPGKGLFFGILGWRRKADEYCAATNDNWWVWFKDLTPAERERENVTENDMAVWCYLQRTSAKRRYVELYREFKDAGMDHDDITPALEDVAQPVCGLGVLREKDIEAFKKGAVGPWEPGQHVRVRAERDAIKQAFGITLPPDGTQELPEHVRVVGNGTMTDEDKTEAAREAAEQLAPSGKTRLGDVVEGEFEDAEDEPEPVEPVENDNRPFVPSYLREKLLERTDVHKDDPPFENRNGAQGLMVGTLEKALGDSGKAKRPEVLNFIFGVASSKDLSDAQIRALLEWLKPEDEDAKIDFIRQEAHALVRAAGEAQGQIDMFDAADEIMGPKVPVSERAPEDFAE